MFTNIYCKLEKSRAKRRIGKYNERSFPENVSKEVRLLEFGYWEYKYFLGITVATSCVCTEVKVSFRLVLENTM